MISVVASSGHASETAEAESPESGSLRQVRPSGTG
jgi:hypothetical protein